MATAISSLRRSNEPQQQITSGIDTDNVIDAVINEMNQPQQPPPQNMDYRANINAENFNYATDYAQIPQQSRFPQNFLNAPPQYSEEMPNKYGGHSNILASVGIANDSSIGKLFLYLRVPVIIFVIIFVVSLPQFNRALFGLFPSLIEETGNITTHGVALKSLVGMLFYLVINHFFY